MACKNVCKMCDNLIVSQAVNYSADSGLLINIPAGAYNRGQKYCIVVAQNIPAAATITAPVYITIGTGTELYPLVNRCCAQVTACGIRTRTRYATVVSTSATGGTFKMLGNPCCSPDNRLTSIDGTAPTA